MFQIFQNTGISNEGNQINIMKRCSPLDKLSSIAPFLFPLSLSELVHSCVWHVNCVFYRNKIAIYIQWSLHTNRTHERRECFPSSIILWKYLPLLFILECKHASFAAADVPSHPPTPPRSHAHFEHNILSCAAAVASQSALNSRAKLVMRF